MATLSRPRIDAAMQEQTFPSPPTGGDELLDAFTEVRKHRATLIRDFKCAFLERKKMKSVAESHGNDELTLALASLLSRPLPERYNLPSHSCLMPCGFLDPTFDQAIRDSLVRVEAHYPDAMHWMRETQRLRNLSCPDVLEGLLCLYIETAAVYPY